MNVKELLSAVKKFMTPQNMVILLAVSTFLPYIFTAVYLLTLAAVVLATPQLQRGLLNFRGAFLIPAFCAYAFLIALFRRNLAGLVIAPVFLLIMMVFCFVRRFITRETFETALTAVCFTVFPAFITAVVEAVMATQDNGLIYRCSSYFGNANYFGAMMAAILLICAYRIVSAHGRGLFYYIVGVTAVLCIYLSGSLFAIIEVITGVALYLLFSKHYRLFCAMVIVGSLGILLITALPELLPRLSESSMTTGYRVRIWGIAIREIKSHPLFGRGFMAYNEIKDLYEGSYVTVHGHNLMLDSLMNFGIVGTALLFSMFYFLLRRVALCFGRDRNSTVVTLIIALAGAVVAHSFTDITFFWIQTGTFYMFFLGAIGCEERRLEIPPDYLIFGRYRI